jgi:hypothetical protein
VLEGGAAPVEGDGDVLEGDAAPVGAVSGVAGLDRVATGGALELVSAPAENASIVAKNGTARRLRTRGKEAENRIC